MMNTDLEALLRDAGRTPPASGVDVTRAVARARTVRKRRRLGLVGGAAAVVLAAGATFAVVGLPQVDRSPAAGADPVLTRLGPGGMDALLHGVVRRSGDCLLLDPGGDATFTLHFSVDCNTVIINTRTDNCTGARHYLSASDAGSTLVRR